MAALTADVNVSTIGEPRTAYALSTGADTFYKGAILYSDATAGGCQVVPAATDAFLGVCAKQVVTTASGERIEYWAEGFIWVPIGSGIGVDDENDLLIHDIGSVQTDNWADCEAANDVTLAANDIAIGRIVKVETARMLIHIGPWSGMIYSVGPADFSFKAST